MLRVISFLDFVQSPDDFREAPHLPFNDGEALTNFRVRNSWIIEQQLHVTQRRSYGIIGIVAHAAHELDKVFVAILIHM
jgi:hypothetical protein